MGRKTTVSLVATILMLGVTAHFIAQPNRQRPTITSAANVPVPDVSCSFQGAYRIDVADSDRLYSAVRNATSSVPFGDQQQFFLDLSVRLTPPDLLAIECSGGRVSVGSSRAAKVTFLADGRTRQETSPNGSIVRSRVTMTRNSLTFNSSGKAEDTLNVEFRSTDGGRRLHVTRRIYAAQLTNPVVIHSVYDKLSDTVDWSIYGQGLLAGGGTDIQPTSPRAKAGRATMGAGNAAADLRRRLEDWIAATNSRDIEKQMQFYMPQLQAFYLTRNTPVTTVRAEKNRAFRSARSIDIHAEEPEVVFQNGGQTAVMRFRKQYRIVDGTRTRSGEVIQELRWQLTRSGWKIFSERDVRVIADQ